ncbi:hypothetical protein AB834_01340 [PVC group bacterium (ex Bugula neritina AB1)]|nr:hypothetical protein AB834_01340 [PVC group bacterium (ex Bugula neritina AB1)]
MIIISFPSENSQALENDTSKKFTNKQAFNIYLSSIHKQKTFHTNLTKILVFIHIRFEHRYKNYPFFFQSILLSLSKKPEISIENEELFQETRMSFLRSLPANQPKYQKETEEEFYRRKIKHRRLIHEFI